MVCPGGHVPCVRGCVRGTGGRGPRLRTPFCCPREAPNPAYRLALTRRLAEAGKLIGVDVLDHIVTGDARYVSFREKGWM